MIRAAVASRRIRWWSCATACILALPIPLGVGAGLHLRLSPLLFLQALLIGTPMVPLATLGLATLVLVLVKDRWFCRYLCPTGAMGDALSETRTRRQRWRRLPHLHRYLALVGLGTAAFGFPLIGLLDPIALFSAAWSPLHLGLTLAAWLSAAGWFLVLGLSWLVPYAWCRRICPLGGLQTVATDVRRAIRAWWRRLRAARPAPGSLEPTEGWRRRHLLLVGLGLGTGAFLRRAVPWPSAKRIRPPGSRPEPAFLASCVRCGNCTRACPTQIISPALDLAVPTGFLAPMLSFSAGHCPTTCNACSQVCPTGAIQPYALADKATFIIGTAVIDLDPCLMANGAECDRCVAECPYEAISVTETATRSEPTVQRERCTGCGLCAEKCPAKVIRIVAALAPEAAHPR
jgi:ferredoxin-type protein NapF